MSWCLPLRALFARERKALGRDGSFTPTPQHLGLSETDAEPELVHIDLQSPVGARMHCGHVSSVSDGLKLKIGQKTNSRSFPVAVTRIGWWRNAATQLCDACSGDEIPKLGSGRPFAARWDGKTPTRWPVHS